MATPQTMKSWRFHEFGPIENLKMEEVPVPEPAEGEVLIELAYAALNPADRFLVNKLYPGAGDPPFAVGRDGSGTIAKAAEGGRFAEGDEVVILRSEIGIKREGTLAQYVCVPEASIAPIPSGWSGQQGAAAPLVFLTAWQALVEEGLLEEGKKVLVTGASGGVGTASVILGKALGGQVLALSRSPEKRKKLEELGADFTFDSADPELVKTVRAALDGGRVDVVVENLSGPFLQKSINLTGYKGRICVVGLLAGLKSELVIGTFIFKRVHIVGIAVGGYSPAESQAAWTSIVEAMAKAGKRPVIDRVFAFDQVQEAFARLAEGPMGKVVIGPMSP